MIINTDIKIKKKHWKEFTTLLENQFMFGGKKYALSEGKEITDWVCEIAGNEWILGTMAKYLGRFKNFGREKDLLKIATYSYLLWLKSGFHKLKKEEHDEDVKKEK